MDAQSNRMTPLHNIKESEANVNVVLQQKCIFNQIQGVEPGKGGGGATKSVGVENPPVRSLTSTCSTVSSSYSSSLSLSPHREFTSSLSGLSLSSPTHSITKEETFGTSSSTVDQLPLDLSIDDRLNLETICEQLQFYFSNENLKTDLFMLKNMDVYGYVPIDVLLQLPNIFLLTCNSQDILWSMEFATHLVLDNSRTKIRRKETVKRRDTFYGKLSRSIVIPHLSKETTSEELQTRFEGFGTIESVQLLKKSNFYKRNTLLKPAIQNAGFYAMLEFETREMAENVTRQMKEDERFSVILYNGKHGVELEKEMQEEQERQGRMYRNPVARLNHTGSVHLDAVGEHADALRDGMIDVGTIISIRGAGGLIRPVSYPSCSISFHLPPKKNGSSNDKDNVNRKDKGKDKVENNLLEGDYVSFTVGKNRKSARRYASLVKLEYRDPKIHQEWIQQAQHNQFTHRTLRTHESLPPQRSRRNVPNRRNLQSHKSMKMDGKASMWRQPSRDMNDSWHHVTSNDNIRGAY